MEKETTKLKTAERLLVSLPSEIRGKIIRAGIENIVHNARFDVPNEFWREIAALAKESFAFEIVANHVSHADAFPAAKVGADIATVVNDHASADGQIKGFLMPFAASMKNGAQGQLLNILFNDTRPILEKFGVEPVFTVTQNDITQQRIDRDNAVSFTRHMIKGAREGKGIIVFPEGKVEGGRRDENGGIKGMQQFVKESLQQSLRVSTSIKDKVAVIPVGISGGYNIYDPHRKSLPLDTFLVGLGLSSKSLFKVSVGLPLLFDRVTIRKMDPLQIDKIIGARVAELLLPAERGTFYL